MMLKVAIIITAISIALLLLYGADVAVGGGTEQGFLPFDHKIRGMVLGITSSALPIIGYFISKNKPSKILGIMIIISGLLIVIGSTAFLAIQSSMEIENGVGRNLIAEFLLVIIVGAFITALGLIKIRKSSVRIN
ncbi:MAG: hypothetical protein ACRD9Q_02925 [Nitrososphaeraceae archaeon]